MLDTHMVKQFTRKECEKITKGFVIYADIKIYKNKSKTRISNPKQYRNMNRK